MDENKIVARVEDTLGGGVIDIQTDLVVFPVPSNHQKPLWN